MCIRMVACRWTAERWAIAQCGSLSLGFLRRKIRLFNWEQIQCIQYLMAHSLQIFFSCIRCLFFCPMKLSPTISQKTFLSLWNFSRTETLKHTVSYISSIPSLLQNHSSTFESRGHDQHIICTLTALRSAVVGI